MHARVARRRVAMRPLGSRYCPFQCSVLLSTMLPAPRPDSRSQTHAGQHGRAGCLPALAAHNSGQFSALVGHELTDVRHASTDDALLAT